MTGNNPNQDLVNINAYTKFCVICPFVLKILSGNEILTSNKGHNSITYKQKITGNTCQYKCIITQNLVKFYPFVLIILTGNKILTSIVGYNTITNVRKMKGNNPKLDHVYNQCVYKIW